MDNTQQHPSHSVNRTMSVTMTNGLEKLEKLLWRRRRGSSRRPFELGRANSLTISTSSCANIPQFPQTPYIRPTSNRMYARDEPSALERSGYRSNSFPESSADSPSDLLSASRLSVASAHDHENHQFISRIPKRCSSLLASREFALASLDAFTFAGATTRENGPSSSGIEKALPSPKQVAPQIELRLDTDEKHNHRPRICPVRMDTPPPSDNDDTQAPTTPIGGQIGGDTGRISIVVHPSEPTPGPSPEIRPMANEAPVDSAAESVDTSIPLLERESLRLEEKQQDDQAKEATAQETKKTLSVRDNVLQKNRISSTRSARTSKRARSSSSSTIKLRRSVSASGLRSESTLREPNFGDFLCLSDEDIAEEAPSTPPPAIMLEVSSPSTVASSPSFVSSSSSRSRLFTPPSRPPVCRAPAPPPLSFPASMRNMGCASPTSRSTSTSVSPQSLAPPLSPVSANQRAATAAAFEARRIAAKHHLDLVYVVQLWPKRMAANASMTSTCLLAPKSAPASPTRRTHEGLRPRNSNSSIRSHTITVDHPDSNGKRGRTAAAIRRSPLSARVLAGHGLAAVKPPMFLSGALHAKILNDTHRSNNGEERRWFAFRNADASTPDEYANGLGTAFFAESVPTTVQKRRGSATTMDDEAHDAGAEGDDESGAALPYRARSRPTKTMKADTITTTSMNKGVLFVAYRKKGAAVQEPAEIDLDELYRDAEVLVGLSLRAQDVAAQARHGTHVDDVDLSTTGVSAAASMAATKRLADLFKPLPSAPLS